MRTSGGRVAWVDAGRGFAIVMVVLLHATDWLRSIGFEQPLWANVVLLLSTVRLPLFFTISGLFARKWIEGDWAALWSTKLSLFIWIYVLWSGIATVTFTLGIILQGHDASLLSQLRVTASAFWLPRFELWFIWALGVFFALAKVLRRVQPMLLLTLTGALSVATFSGLFEGNVGLVGAAKYFFFFLMGLMLRDRILFLGESLSLWAKLGAIAGWAGFASVGLFLGARESVFGFDFVTALVGAAAGIAISGWLATVPVLRRIGPQTLPIYVAHTSWIILMCAPLSVLPAEFKIWPGILVLPPLLAVIATLLSLEMASLSAKSRWARYLFEQPSFMLGSRNSREIGEPNPTQLGGLPHTSPEGSVSSKEDDCGGQVPKKVQGDEN